MAKMIRTAFPRRRLPGSGQAANSPATARDALSGLPGATGAGQLMMTTRMHAHTDRIRNLEMVGATFGPDAAGLDRSAKRRRERNPGGRERVWSGRVLQDQGTDEREGGPDVPPPSMTRQRPHLHTRTDHPHLRLITGNARTRSTPRRTAVRVHIQIAVSDRRGHRLRALQSDAPAPPGGHHRRAELATGAGYLAAPAIIRSDDVRGVPV